MKYILIFIILLLISCSTKPTQSTDSEVVTKITEFDLGTIKTVKHDSCDFIVMKNGYGSAFQHSPTCKNKDHMK